MILDSSVIVAIALREPGYEELIGKMRSAGRSDAGRYPERRRGGGRVGKEAAAVIRGRGGRDQ